jgi:S1-C subfamily serine protease
MPISKPRRSILTVAVSALLGAAVVVGGYSLGMRVIGHGAQTPRSRAVTPRSDLGPEELQTISLFESAAPSVVYITTLTTERSLFSMNVFDVPQGAGSGFIWDENGYIVTNFHVIKDAHVARVTLANQSTYNATLVGIEPDKDLAVLKISAPGVALTPIRIGTSKGLRVGQRVYAIGNPFGFDHTLTTGIIGGLGREIKSAVTDRPIQGVIQTDAAINPGNSGGPLLDSSGLLIGINTAIVSPSGSYAGLGFAVPVDTVNRIVPQLIRYGQAKKSILGVRLLETHGLHPAGLHGAIVADVLRGSPADNAGLKPLAHDADGSIHLGDIIVAADGLPVEDGNDLFRVIDDKTPGDTIELGLLNNGEERSVTVKLGVLR